MGSAPPPLDHVTWWEGNYYPGAGEVVAWREHRGRDDGPLLPPRRDSLAECRYCGERHVLSCPTRAETNADRAVRRARTRIRRYAAANLLDRMIVLTWADQTGDLREAQRHVRAFIRYGLRTVLKYRGPYLVGWERHKSGRWHANVLVNRRIEHSDLADAWGRGFVWIKRWEGRGPRSSKRDAARQGARYVAKYIAKDLGDLPPGIHRYEVGQGFTVRVVRVYGTSPTSLLLTISRPVAYRFDAGAPEAGRGPPIMWAALGDASGRGSGVSGRPRPDAGA